MEERLGCKVNLDHPIVPWMVRHAAQLIARYQIRACGKTSYRQAKGHDSILPVCEFGETIHFKPLKTISRDQTGSVEDRMVEGIWLGKVIRSEENIVAVKGEAGATSGIYKVGDIMRQEATVRWSKEAIDTIKGTPKDPCPDLVRTNAPRHTIPTYTNPNARQYRKPSEVVAQEDEAREI